MSLGFESPNTTTTTLEHVQVLARLGFGVPGPHFAQQPLDPEAGRRAGAAVLFERGPAVGQR